MKGRKANLVKGSQGKKEGREGKNCRISESHIRIRGTSKEGRDSVRETLRRERSENTYALQQRGFIINTSWTR